MNKENAKDYLPLVQALAEGKTIQVKTDSGGWTDSCNEVGFVFPASEYRVKPAPIERWLVVCKDGSETIFYTEESAKEYAARCRNVTIRHLIEKL